MNNDGLQDIYLACDYGTDRMYFNNGDGTFREVTEKAIGYDTKEGMNAEIADYDNDGWMDIYVTNIYDEYMKRVQRHAVAQTAGDGTFTGICRRKPAPASRSGDGARSSAISIMTAGSISSW